MAGDKAGGLPMPFRLMMAAASMFFIFCVTLIPCFFLILLLHLFVGSISRRRGVLYCSKVAGSCWRVYQFMAESLFGMEITFSGELPKLGESAIVVANHVSFSDFYLVQAVAQRGGMLEHLKYMVKQSTLRIPVFGWTLDALGTIGLRRNWGKDERMVRESFDRINTLGVPIYLIIFPEGTRFSEEKARKSREFCKSKNLPEFSNVLYPRTKGFEAALSGFSKAKQPISILDLTFVFSDSTRPGRVDGCPSMWAMHQGSCSPRYRFHVHCKRHSLIRPEQAGGWLRDRFGEKDEFIESCHANWPGTPGSSVETIPAPYPQLT